MLFVVLVVLLAGVVVIRGISSRIKAAAIVKQETLELSVPSVSVGSPQNRSAEGRDRTTQQHPGFRRCPHLRAHQRVSQEVVFRYRHARESRPVDRRHRVAGSRAAVAAGARNTLATSQANLRLAEINQDRYQALWKLDSCSKQDLDNAIATYEADKATVAAGAANVKYYEQLVAFEKVIAPFDGVITARNTDIGQLINAGNGGAPLQLFRIAATNKLRIFLSVPQMYSRSAIAGVGVDVTLTELAGAPFPRQSGAQRGGHRRHYAHTADRGGCR
jgi:hypothetical protein